ncbi:MAG: RluA family pseudouridine synthase [Flavobacteriales bacterium]|nr:RluA family pseudouridine synthase [Flavobacteriales bacterium]
MRKDTIDRNRILFEDNHLIAVNKEAGELVQGDHTGDVPLIDKVKEYIRRTYDKPGEAYLGMIHRLDRPVSGIVLFAKSSKALSRMNELFRIDEVEKTYWALVERKPKELSAELTNWLSKDNEKNRVKAYDKESKGSKKAVLSYAYLGTANHKFLLEVKPKTGRPHQIRVQLAKIGLPISGDLKYGSERGRGHMIYLHAKELSFVHPVRKERITLRCPLPDETNWRFFREFDASESK